MVRFSRQDFPGKIFQWQDFPMARFSRVKSNNVPNKVIVMSQRYVVPQNDEFP